MSFPLLNKLCASGPALTGPQCHAIDVLTPWHVQEIVLSQLQALLNRCCPAAGVNHRGSHYDSWNWNYSQSVGKVCAKVLQNLLVALCAGGAARGGERPPPLRSLPHADLWRRPQVLLSGYHWPSCPDPAKDQPGAGPRQGLLGHLPGAPSMLQHCQPPGAISLEGRLIASLLRPNA